MIWMDIANYDPTPKRGDLLQSNLGTRRERTWLILKATRRRCKRRSYNVFAARWWELDPELRIRLYQSALRNGGQHSWFLKRYPAKKKHTFEDYIGRLP